MADPRGVTAQFSPQMLANLQGVESLLGPTAPPRMAPRPTPRPTSLLEESIKSKQVENDGNKLSYFDKYVSKEELGDADREKYYDATNKKWMVYQLPGEEFPTVGEGLYLDANARKKLNLSKVPKVGEYISEKKVNDLVRERWKNAIKTSKKRLSGTNGKSSIAAYSEMLFQMGDSKGKFPETLKLLKAGKLKEAREEAKKSPWFKTQSPERASRVINRFGSGVKV